MLIDLDDNPFYSISSLGSCALQNIEKDDYIKLKDLLDIKSTISKAVNDKKTIDIEKLDGKNILNKEKLKNSEFNTLLTNFNNANTEISRFNAIGNLLLSSAILEKHQTLMNNLNNSELALNDFVVNNINNVYPILTINDKTENKPRFNTVFGEWSLQPGIITGNCEKYFDLYFILNNEERPWSKETLALLKDEDNRVLNIKVSTNADDIYYNKIREGEITFEWKQPKIELDSSTHTIKYGLEKALNISVKEKSACTIDPLAYKVNEYFTFTADNALPLGLSLTENATIIGTVQEEFDPWGFNTTDIIVSYPGAEDEEITINWEYVKPEITADSSITFDGKVNEELNTFNYTPEIGPSEFYTDKTKFTYLVGTLPQGVLASNSNGKLVISGTPEEEFNKTTTVTISYPYAENKELSIEWNIEKDEKKCYICGASEEFVEHKCPVCNEWICTAHEEWTEVYGELMPHCINCNVICEHDGCTNTTPGGICSYCGKRCCETHFGAPPFSCEVCGRIELCYKCIDNHDCSL